MTLHGKRARIGGNGRGGKRNLSPSLSREGLGWVLGRDTVIKQGEFRVTRASTHPQPPPFQGGGLSYSTRTA
jgi:hypothetical protein